MSAYPGFEAFVSAAPSVWKSVGLWQLECVALIGRRSRAYLDFSHVLSTCHSPEDVLGEQLKFWNVAQQQYQAAFEKALMGSGLPVTAPPASRALPRRSHDYLVVTAASAEKAKAVTSSDPEVNSGVGWAGPGAVLPETLAAPLRRRA